MDTTIWRIARREWVDWSRDPWRVGGGLLLAIFAAAAGATGTAAADARASAAWAAQQADYQRWLTQPPRNAHSASHFGISAFYVPSRLSLMDPGVGAYAGSALFLEAHKQNEPVFTEAVDRGAAARFGDLSLSTVIQIFLPLVVILLGAGTIAAEREDGILPQVLSAGVSPRQLALGKTLFVLVTTLVLLAPAVVVVVLTLPRSAGAWPADAGLRFLTLGAAAAAYLTFWVALTIAVSARASAWRVATAVLATMWGGGVVIVPRLATDIARERNPLPSRAEQDRLDLQARILPPGGVEKRKQEILAEFGVERAEDLPIELNVILARRAEARINARLDVRIQRYTEVYAAERSDYLKAAWLTPAIAIDLALAGAAGSDEAHHRAFLARAEKYRREMNGLLSEADERKPGERAQKVDGVVWSRLPIFEPEVPHLRAAGSGIGLSLLILGVWSLLSSAVAWWTVTGMPARA